jgi:hypothetical protein
MLAAGSRWLTTHVTDVRDILQDKELPSILSELGSLNPSDPPGCSTRVQRLPRSQSSGVDGARMVAGAAGAARHQPHQTCIESAAQAQISAELELWCV